MGIDVRAYAQKGENIVRSSCVGCGICSAVCPRGVLKLENGPQKGRIDSNEILLGNNVDLMDLVNQR
jgi:ferredoxin